jgi:phosphatidylserine synthase 2
VKDHDTSFFSRIKVLISVVWVPCHMQYILWVPPRNMLNTYRLLILFLLGIPAAKEWYMFIESDQSNAFNKLGVFGWLAGALAIIETLICIKFGTGLFPKPWPAHVLWCWGAVGVAFAVVFALWSARFYGGMGIKEGREKSQ